MRNSEYGVRKAKKFNGQILKTAPFMKMVHFLSLVYQTKMKIIKLLCLLLIFYPAILKQTLCKYKTTNSVFILYSY